MKRVLFALIVVALAAAATFSGSTPQGAKVNSTLAAWLGANALPKEPVVVTAVELPVDGTGLRALDAALALRTILRFEPKAIALLGPLERGDSESLFLSKLSDAKVPVVFTSNAALPPLPNVALSHGVPSFPAFPALVPPDHPAGGAMPGSAKTVMIAARQGDRAVPSNVLQFCLTVAGISPGDVKGGLPGYLRAGDLAVPVSVDGRTGINPLAGDYVQRITLDQLMLRAERSEQGAISVDLDTLFRGRMVVLQKEGEAGAPGVAALCNRLVEAPLPTGSEWGLLLVVATLPWWPGRRIDRALLALGVSGLWVLMSLAVYQEFQVAAPLLVMLLLPLLALIPPGPAKTSDKVEQGKLPV
jgi:hypothetical protein